jgi:hypothetical protein
MISNIQLLEYSVNIKTSKKLFILGSAGTSYFVEPFIERNTLMPPPAPPLAEGDKIQKGCFSEESAMQLKGFRAQCN